MNMTVLNFVRCSVNFFRPRDIPVPSSEHKANLGIQDEVTEQHKGNGLGNHDNDGTREALFHVSVKERMELDDEHWTRTWRSMFLKKQPYWPYARTSKIEPIYVE